jgi:alpha-1,3-rhamnosyl/mannosyltransferase
MRVLLNALVTAGPRTGIGHYVVELARGLRALALGEGTVELFPGPWLRLGYRLVRLAARARRATSTDGPGRAGLADGLRRACQALLQRYFTSQCRRGGYAVYHEPNFVPFEADVPTVVTVHDLSVLLRPEWHPADRVRRFESGFARGMARGRHFLAISESARQEVIRVLGVPAERVTRTYMGARRGLRPLPVEEVSAGLRRLSLPERYLLYLGTLEPRKNVGTLLRAYAGLPAPVRARYPLLLVGGWGWRAGPLAAQLDGQGRASGARHLGYMPERHLPLLYNGARALCFPSYYEGFGLPPVEMLACGGAVLASTAEAVAETAGARAHLVGPDDLDGWRAALLRVCTDDDWWASLRHGAVEAARPYTWERCAAETLVAYRVASGAERAGPVPPEKEAA